MKKISFFVGLGFNKDGEELSTKSVQSRRLGAFAKLMVEYGGFTSVQTFGGYTAKNGDKVFEPGEQYIVYGEQSERTVENTAKFLKELFEQEQVLYSIEDAPEARFV